MKSLQELAMLDALLTHWDGILIRLGTQPPSFAVRLAAVANRLSKAYSSDDIAQILDDLFDLLEDTAACDYVQGLIACSQLTPEPEPSLRGMLGAEYESFAETERVTRRIAVVANALGRNTTSASGYRTVQVFFATNRQRLESDSDTFSGELAEKLTYGRVDVTIPCDDVHQIGQIESPEWWQFLVDENDPRRFVVSSKPEIMTYDQFASKLPLSTDRSQDILIFIHGYRVSFVDAARRAAQFALDAGFSGRVVLFSWPSKGCVWGYVADEERALNSAKPFATFIGSLEEGPWSKVHVVAHSMGNRVMLLGLAGSNIWPNAKLSQIVFTAADVSVELFDQQFPEIAENANCFTSYVSSKDWALSFSHWLQDDERIGITDGEPFVTDGLETIDATSLNTDLLSWGHSYPLEERSVLTDIGYLVREGLRAERRGLSSRDGKRGRFWKFPK